MGFKLMAGAVASCALIGVAVGVGIIYGSLLSLSQVIFIGMPLVYNGFTAMICDYGIVEVYLLQYPNTNLNYLIPNL